jgi:1,4-dihydroxy-2-naphthoate octaprenyltransferase
MYISLIISSILNYIPLISLISLLLLYRTIKLVKPLFSINENEIDKKSDEIKMLWRHPFWFRIIMLIIIVASMIITKFKIL